MADENVVQLPTLLERLALRLTGYLGRDHTNRAEWIEIQEGVCLTLAEAREQFAADVEFGQWCDSSGFGADVINHQTRAAAIAMGQEPEALRKCLEATERRSLQHIYVNDFGRFTHVSKPPRRQAKFNLKSSPQRKKAKDAIDDLEAEGEPITYKAVRERAGISDTPIRAAIAEKRAEAALDPLTPAEMNKTMARRYELAVRKARAEIREELKAEVYKELDVYVLHWKERIERADRILANHDGIMSRDAYRKIKACLHPDHNTFVHAVEALQIFTEAEDLLVKADVTAVAGPPLPTTAAELMARRRRQ